MKKVIIILSLIYFISCSSYCEDTTSNVPTKKEDCYERQTTVTKNECCFATGEFTLDGQKKSSMSCGEVPLGSDLEEVKKKAIQEAEAIGIKVDSFNIYCPSHEKKSDIPSSSSSYLKIGFLLILCFIL